MSLPRSARRLTVLIVPIVILLCKPSPALGRLLGPITATDLENSANAAVLVDGAYDLDTATGWAHARNQWSALEYPWAARLDLGGMYNVKRIRAFSGRIPVGSNVRLIVEGSTDGTTYVRLGVLRRPRYNGWRTRKVNGAFRYVRVSFVTVQRHFEIMELRIYGNDV